MAKSSIFSDVSTLVCKRGEKTFPFMCFEERPVWDDLYLYWAYYVRRMKDEGIKIGWHKEVET
jgi:hypothetical protein